ncbi:hypothetical protein B0H67DRAFT_610299, partial [Lasiosphaeris hirsuta]
MGTNFSSFSRPTPPPYNKLATQTQLVTAIEVIHITEAAIGDIGRGGRRSKNNLHYDERFKAPSANHKSTRPGVKYDDATLYKLIVGSGSKKTVTDLKDTKAEMIRSLSTRVENARKAKQVAAPALPAPPAPVYLGGSKTVEAEAEAPGPAAGTAPGRQPSRLTASALVGSGNEDGNTRIIAASTSRESVASSRAGTNPASSRDHSRSTSGAT